MVPKAIGNLAFFLKKPKSQKRTPAQPTLNLPKGILLTGPTGAGKTFLIKALEQAAPDAAFVFEDTANLTDAKAVNSVFNQATSQARSSDAGYCVLVLENFDIFSLDLNPMNKTVETRPEVLGLCQAMDESTNVITIGISHTKNYDVSLLRSCRFGTIIDLPLPTQSDRAGLMRHFGSICNLKFSSSINLDTIALVLYGFTPADIRQLIETAALSKKMDNLPVIDKEHLHEAAFTVFRSKGFLDKEFITRLRIAVNLLAKNKPQKQGFARIVGTIPLEVRNLVEQLRDDTTYKHFKLKLPKGILFAGPPGTGKTTLARAIAEEVGCAFVATSGSEFANQYVGGGAQAIRNLFEEARAKAKDSPNGKVIIFIDELDSIGKRTGNLTDSTITELLVQMDGFSEDDPIIVLGASNHPKNIDAALLRPGRFDKIIKVGLPDTATRKLLLENYLDGIPLASDVSITTLANATSNFSPAELGELVQKAATLAKDISAQKLETEHLVSALRKSLQEKILKGDKQAKQQIDAIEVLFLGKKTAQKGFARIAGGVPTEISDLVAMITNPSDYTKFGLTCPNGILFTGPPGTGKTLLAKAIAEEVGCEFIETKGSEFIEKYVGVGAQRVRELFQEAREKSETNRFGKTIIFIDELDAIGSRSGSALDTEASRTITELLTQMDGFSKDNSVIVIAATNRPNALDAALLRAGRFDTTVEIGLPNLAKRKALLQLCCKAPLANDVSFDVVAAATDGFNAADLTELVNKAALNAMRAKQSQVTQADFDWAIQTIVAAKMGQKISYV